MTKQLRIFQITFIHNHIRQTLELYAPNKEDARVMAFQVMAQKSALGNARVLRVEEVAG